MRISDLLGWIGPLYLVAVTWPLARVDLRERRLPNKYTMPAFPLIALGQLFAVAGGEPISNFLVAVLAGLIAFAACVALNRYAGLGMGDVKLIAAITFALAWFNPLLPAIALVIAFVLAGIVTLALLALKKTNTGSSIALGPYLLVGFLLSLIVQGLS